MASGDVSTQAAAPGPASPETVLRISNFLYHEAALLDARQFEAWLDLYSDDAIYWLPSHPAASPTHDVSLVYDDRARLQERVKRLCSGFTYAQNPPTRTCHVVGNVRLLREIDGDLEIASNLVVAEVRRGVQTVYAAQVTHQLVPRGESWQIRRKVIHLLNSDLPLGNLTFLL